jgi:hypothetical protein
LSPVMAKMGTYEDGEFRPAQVDTVADAADKQEPLFHDFLFTDSELAVTLNAMFEAFTRKELLGEVVVISGFGISLTTTTYLSVLRNMMNAFTLYKTASASVAVQHLTSIESQSYWYEASIEWLKRRPSYAKAA